MVVAVQNFAGLMALRWFLGMAESAFFPLVIYYQTTFYRRGELVRRLAIFYAASSIASAFGGLLAFGVFQIEGGSIANWRYLFVSIIAATFHTRVADLDQKGDRRRVHPAFCDRRIPGPSIQRSVCQILERRREETRLLSNASRLVLGGWREICPQGCLNDIQASH